MKGCICMKLFRIIKYKYCLSRSCGFIWCTRVKSDDVCNMCVCGLGLCVLKHAFMSCMQKITETWRKCIMFCNLESTGVTGLGVDEIDSHNIKPN